ncbi:dihydrolipoamide acetyltransferase [Oceanivirga miroungae]|uniref:Dihydrolipoamide acetyltransferase n=1 Tax=Oceanivirga miroungae TaxID=1130046 RepID=A0A6I8MDK7_9FUSO|nr:dihydrolipoamide acetyltransferase [Oceanivirga miroungae]VWL85533.1 dihydrolipoamide acetyltransferase [Oceanivirga miroungae]
MNNEKLRATPAARKEADVLNIDLSKVIGTGINNRIHKDDVIEFSHNSFKVTPLAKKMALVNNIDLTKVIGTGVRGKITKDDILKLIEPEVVVKEVEVKKEETIQEEVNKNQFGNIERVKMSSMRKVIAKRMVESYLGAPTFIINYEVDMTELLALRKSLVDPIMEKTGMKLTVTDLISIAVIKTLKKHPYVNSSLVNNGTEIELHDYVNLAIAVGFDGGLLTPVIFNSDSLSISEFVEKSKDVTKRALNMKLKANELENSTFTISNLGMFGVSSFGAIINQPNSAILAVSATIEKPVALNGEVVIRPMMNLALTVDHRVVDGLEGAKFMKDLKQLIENPMGMLI